MKTKLALTFILTLLGGVLLNNLCLAEEDYLTITTYYPSPYGSYNELDTRTLWFGHEINGRIGFNYPATSTDYNRRLRITAGRNDTFDNTQGASIDLHGNNYTDISGMRGRLDLVAGTATEGNITFWTGNPVNERMRITREGRVGIGTMPPLGKLSVVDSSISPAVYIESRNIHGWALDVYGRQGNGNVGANAMRVRSDWGTPLFISHGYGGGTNAVVIEGSLTSGGTGLYIGNIGGSGIRAYSHAANWLLGYGEGLNAVLFVKNVATFDEGYVGYFVGKRNYFSGAVGIGVLNPDYRLQLPNTADNNGKGYANQWIDASSIRWKTNIKPIENALEKTLKLRGVSFNWKDNRKKCIGLIAEEVGEVIPEVVSYEENNKDANGISYDHLVALLIEAIKEQQKEIEVLKKRIEELISK